MGKKKGKGEGDGRANQASSDRSDVGDEDNRGTKIEKQKKEKRRGEKRGNRRGEGEKMGGRERGGVAGRMCGHWL